MKSIGLDLPGKGGVGGGVVGRIGGCWETRKREALMREARYGVGSILVEEGKPQTSVFIIVEGECRIIKGKARSKPTGEGVGVARIRSSCRINTLKSSPSCVFQQSAISHYQALVLVKEKLAQASRQH